MKDDQQKFLALLGKPPARLMAEQVAWALNCQPHDVPALVAARVLKPLGTPAVNGIKFFAASDVFELGNDRERLAKMTNIITQHWREKNKKTRRKYLADFILKNECQKIQNVEMKI